MFELSVACKYLIPRRRQLSVSIISLISVLVIATVVWLVVVFFSVTEGLEKNWITKLTSLTAPVRITPKEAYFNSHYYLVDSISDASQYTLKTIGEKAKAPATDPYNTEIDQEIPIYWMKPDTDEEGHIKDLVKLAFLAISEIQGVKGLSGTDFELTGSNIHLELHRRAPFVKNQTLLNKSNVSEITYPVYLTHFEADNDSLKKHLTPPSIADLNNLLKAIQESATSPGAKQVIPSKLHQFFATVTIEQLKPLISGWKIPPSFLPQDGTWKGCVILKEQTPLRVIVPKASSEVILLEKQLLDLGLNAKIGTIQFQGKERVLYIKDFPPLPISHIPILADENTIFNAQLEKTSIEKAKALSDLQFSVQIPIQNTLLIGIIPYKQLEIKQAITLPPQDNSLWTHSQYSSKELPKDKEMGQGILLPKSFQTAGVLLGDRGELGYFSQGATVLQENPLPIYVSGFYDPGIIPMGGKFLLANRDLIQLIRSAHALEEVNGLTNGINVRFASLSDADTVKKELLKKFQEKGIDRYWNVETYKDFEFTKPILRELQSQKNLFMLIAVVIVLVACSNIISMLIILVNDKKTEIGILRSMGATSTSIALIFGISGGLIGVLGSFLGIAAAILTLSHLDLLVHFLSSLQGHEMFSEHLYGQTLPSELSFDALSFVCAATVCLSLLAGIVPAIKACLLRPSQILRSGGE